ncbi:MAG: hypothetical protein ACT4O1_13495 [Gemmatimonadota bacterium]
MILETRLNYTFSPALSLQVYLQPLVAAGEYSAIKELAAPNSFDFNVYGEDVGTIEGGRVYPRGSQPGAVSFALPRPDFNIRSLRGNAVLRWEWRPGSTMFVACQQQRSQFVPIGDFDAGRDFDRLFGPPPDNILLLKVSYWLNP